MVILHGQAIDTLGVLARTVGREHFLPLVPDCMQLGKVLACCVCTVCVSVNCVCRVGCMHVDLECVFCKCHTLYSTVPSVTHCTVQYQVSHTVQCSTKYHTLYNTVPSITHCTMQYQPSHTVQYVHISMVCTHTFQNGMTSTDPDLRRSV